MDATSRTVFATLLFSVFATVIGVGIVVPLLPIHAHRLGASGLHIALVFGAYAVSRALFLPVFGHLSDRNGRKTFLTVGLFAYATISLALAYLDSIVALVVIRLLHGVASAMLIPVFQAYAAELAPAGREGRVMGLYGTVVLVGMSLGPFVGGVVNDHWGLRATFWIMGALALLGFVACAWLLPPTASEQSRREENRPSAWPHLLRDRTVASLFGFRFAYVVCVGIIWAFVPLYAAFKLSLSAAQIGLIITLGIASAGLLNTPMGILADRINRRVLVVIGGLVAAYGIFAFETAQSHAAFVLASVCFGTGGGICMPALMALAAQKGHRSDAMASVMALMTVAHSLGMLVGALLGGLMMDAFDLRFVFPAGAGVMLLGTLHFVATSRLGERVSERGGTGDDLFAASSAARNQVATIPALAGEDCLSKRRGSSPVPALPSTALRS
jgi:MFS family permease